MLISVPSYVIPGTYLENVVYCADVPEIGGIELLFFLYDDETDRLFASERAGISNYRSRFSFSVHMPDELGQHHEKILNSTMDLADAYVVHEPESDIDGFARIIDQWRSSYGDVFYLENLIGRDFHRAAELLADMPICFDTGHVLCRRESPARFADRYGERIREIHIHGLSGGEDHHPFGGDEQWFSDLLPFLKNFSGRLNIELFDISQVRAVLDILNNNDVAENQ